MASYSKPVTFAGPKPARKDTTLAPHSPPIDWAQVDVLAAIEQHTSTRLHREGKQWAGACPFDDCSVDENGFVVWPSGSKFGQHYYCRGCGRKGDLITLLRELRGWSFLEAKQALGLLCDADEPAYQRSAQSSSARHAEQARQTFFCEQLEQLRHLYPRMRAALTFELPDAYLASRGITVEQAQRYGLAYLPKPVEPCKEDDPLKKWYGRLLFPLSGPEDEQPTFAGRTLLLWQPGMTPEQHKAAIDAHNAALPPGDPGRIVRVVKTSPCGWFGFSEAMSSREPIFCEGEFDALSLKLAGVEAALAIGTGFDCKRIPMHVERAILALDCDEAGARANRKLAQDLASWGLETRVMIPPAKDWNDAAVAVGADAIRALFAAPVAPAPTVCTIAHSEPADEPGLCATHLPPPPMSAVPALDPLPEAVAADLALMRARWGRQDAACIKADRTPERAAADRLFRAGYIVSCDDFMPEEYALLQTLRGCAVRLRAVPCLRCGCHLARDLFGAWECAACEPYNGWSYATLARIGATRPLSEDENQCTSVAGALASFTA